MIGAVRVVQVNLAADPALADPEQLLDAYHTLTGWSEAMAGAGASVHVVQRFSTDAVATRHAVPYTFVHDDPPGIPAPFASCARVAEAVAATAPDVVHVNGLMFPGMVNELRRAMPRACIVLQDHSGAMPRRVARALTALRWQRAFRRANACTFTARELAERWRTAGLPTDLRVIEVPEASTPLRPIVRSEARARTGLRGSPAVLWVGRFDRNKDPITVLTGLADALPAAPDAHVTMIVPAGASRAAVVRTIADRPALHQRVTLIGPVAHAAMAAYYTAADIFVSGSHHEGSGYALIESMACGLVPCITDIPAFRALVGACGVRWKAGDPASCAHAFRWLLARDMDAARTAVLRRFHESLSWDAIGRQTVMAYAELRRAMGIAG
jgi:glycosyltransferase involved in cell wall biosynthesis